MLKPQASGEAKKWLEHIAAYEREFEKWEHRAKKIIDRYKDENRAGHEATSEVKYNVLWSNVQTLTAATFARVPKPDVSRRFKDQDPVGRVAGMVLERALEYEVQKYSTFAATLKSCVQDRFLGGRGTGWVRYEPHFKAQEKQQPQDGLEITEDVDQPQEELDYECAPCDYVHWRDFGHVNARTWEEVPAVWRMVYLTREQCIERFGDKGNTLPLDARPEDERKKRMGNQSTDSQSRALIYEIWDKTTKQAIWLSKSLGEIIDQQPDPLGLEDFFPCPKPLYSTLSNESLIPIPDFTLYQDQANTLDLLSERISGLIKALKIAGGYDSSIPELARIFTEGSNNTLIPIKNWAAFAEKQGLRGAVSLVDITPIASALQSSYVAMEHVKQQIYDITGISDIIRGQTAASETATAQQIKGQYASLRLKTLQDDVARFATEILRIQSQIICKQFSHQTLVTISAADQLPESDKQLLEPAIAFLSQQGPNPIRMFRIEVAADSLIQMNESQDKQERMEFIQAISGFMEKVLPLAQAQPQALPMVGEMLKFGTRSFKAGKTMEGAIDSAIDSMGKQPPPNPEMEQAKQQMQQQGEQMQQQFQAAQGQLQAAGQKLEQERQKLEQDKLALAYEQKLLGLQKEVARMFRTRSMEGMPMDGLNGLETQDTAVHEEMGEGGVLNIADALSSIKEANAEMASALTAAIKAMTAPKRIVRDESGRVAGVESVAV